MKNFQRGFVSLFLTAIVGTMFSVVLISLDTARSKGQDARIRANLSSLRPSAEMYYDKNKMNYSVAHSCDEGMFANDTNFVAFITDLKTKTKTNLTCFAEASTYAVSASLSTPGEYVCVDSTGFVGAGVATDENSKTFCKSNLTN